MHSVIGKCPQNSDEIYCRFVRRQSDYEKVKVKVKFTLEQATKSQRGSRGIALLFL
jgi:hypothetical protein